MPSSSPKIAIVCDFLTMMGGAENVILAMHEAFPSAPIYTAIYNKDKLPLFKEVDVRPSRLQKIPAKLRKYYKLFPTLAVKSMRKLDLDEFDIILTSSYLHANQVTKTRPDQLIISYCHTPARYYWSHYDLYRKDPGYGKLNPLVRSLMPLMIPRQRKLDYNAAQNVDVFMANSTETQERIKKYYDKPSMVLHPPVEIKRFSPARVRGDHYVTLGRQLPNKRFDLAVEACTQLGLKLKVFGNGPLHDTLVRKAGPTIEFHTDRFGDASDEEVEKALNTAKGFVFPSDEDFGIVAVEALAAGAPVIAYDKAGTRDIIQDNISGVMFGEQTVEAVASAIQKADKMTFLPSTLARKAKRFERSMFIDKLRRVVLQEYAKHSR
ncbi:glycosyltransferase [Candidatus Saccharibacteria bacterium]|nr:glycosyltransferase [Candidatus Saccharibacteria bacterium]